MARNESSPIQTGVATRRRTTLIWWSLAAGSLLAGYADLVRGGETIAPILLVLGYCVLVPLAILRS
jgi:hypothetical protein